MSKQTKKHQMYQEITKVENVKNWKKFVANWVVMQTLYKADRELVGGYQVKSVGDGYKIFFGGKDAAYGVMTAEDLYGWMERLPLRYYMREADEIRQAILSA